MRIFILIVLCFLTKTIIAQPLNDIVKRSVMEERKPLAYAPVREADIMWEKRIWRVIDTHEKMNQRFSYPEAPFFKILVDAAKKDEIELYSTEDDKFSYPLDEESLNGLLYSRDTIPVMDPETGDFDYQVVENEMNFEDVKRFRLKEVWFFDTNSGSMKVRILGIAPMINVNDDNGNFRYEKPLFWIHYPSCREMLANKKTFMPENDMARISWEDLFEMRFFSSYIYKASNINDRRLQDYLTGVDLLLEADKIKQEIFNFEHDLWSY